MKRAIQLVMVITVLGALGLSAWGCGSITAADNTPGSVYVVGQTIGISVSGTGRVVVVPDLAILNMGVQVQAATVAEARQMAAQVMDEVMAALEDLGIADKDITTSSYSIYPIYDYRPDKAVAISGYSVSNYVAVKIREIDNSGDVIDAVAAAGGNDIRIDSISFTVDKPEKYNAEARELAMADAHARAEQLAKLGGIKLGKPSYIAESGGYYAIPPVYYENSLASAAPGYNTSISPGETTVTVSVQVTYNIQ